jgi:biopolymer transport protein ExbD
MKKFSASKHGSLSELNITPLLDLVFVLLVIFIITTPQLANELDLNLPTGGPKPPPDKRPQIHRLFVDQLGGVQFEGRLYAVTNLSPVLLALQKSDPDPSVVVIGHHDVEYQKVIKVLDALQQADVTKIGLAAAAATGAGPPTTPGSEAP